jgi:hypothetical protein
LVVGVPVALLRLRTLTGKMGAIRNWEILSLLAAGAGAVRAKMVVSAVVVAVQGPGISTVALVAPSRMAKATRVATTRPTCHRQVGVVELEVLAVPAPAPPGWDCHL